MTQRPFPRSIDNHARRISRFLIGIKKKFVERLLIYGLIIFFLPLSLVRRVGE